MGVKGRSFIMYPNLKLRLWTTGLRQNRLAKMLDIDETTLSKIVNGFRQPTAEVRGRIAAALSSDEEWLFQSSLEVSSLASDTRPAPEPVQRRVPRRSRASASV
jgi:transcriptional regulator with XRE-family HTH domain